MTSINSLRPLSFAVAVAFIGAASPVQAQTAGNASSDVAQLPSVTVSPTGDDATLQRLDVPVAAGALGTRAALDTPFSSSVVTRSELQERQILKLGDIFATDASVSDNSGAYGAWASYLTVRGLDLDWQNSFRIDGKPFISFVTVMPVEHMEQVELRKGATGFLNGFGAPGGLVNYVTKKPGDVPMRAVSLGYVSDSIFSQHVDIGDRVADGRFGYRINATHEQGDTFQDGTLKRNSLSLALDARITDRLTWEWQSILQDRDIDGQEATIRTSALPAGGGLPGTIRNDNGRLVGGGNFVDNAFRFHSTGLKYSLSPDWTASASYSHSTTRTRRNETVLRVQDVAGNYVHDQSDYGEGYELNYGQAMLEGRVSTGSVKHQIVVGGSWLSRENDYSADGYYGTLGSGSLAVANPYRYSSPAGLSLYRAAKTTEHGLFISDTIDLSERWSVLGGLRHTRYEQDNFSTTGARTSRYAQNVNTPTLALMFKPDAATTAYASYVESLEQGQIVGPGYVNAGTALAPLDSKQYEVGIKTQRDGWSASAALFRIERKSEYVNAANTVVQDGQSRYQGLELGAATRLGRAWTLGGNLMLLDTEYAKGQANVGNRVAGAPRFVAAAQLGYQVAQLPGLSLRADVKYTGDTSLRAAGGLSTAGYALVNVGARYDTRLSGYETTFRVGINNLLNKEYWMYQYADYVKPGDPRTLAMSVTAKF
ncbi:TonB-dependent siderophore receptor [Pigmentiphaga aceris]|uniref:TonB-dependent siderophore receptor n=1 Tax=Pigmentiphaga aceris TaxID=1940612 RepID=UPI003CCC6298